VGAKTRRVRDCQDGAKKIEFFQGDFFLAGVTAADDVVWSSAVCASDFCNEDDGTREERVSKLDAIYQRGGISVTLC
jgi:hypothetical protein